MDGIVAHKTKGKMQNEERPHSPSAKLIPIEVRIKIARIEYESGSIAIRDVCPNHLGRIFLLWRIRRKLSRQDHEHTDQPVTQNIGHSFQNDKADTKLLAKLVSIMRHSRGNRHWSRFKRTPQKRYRSVGLKSINKSSIEGSTCGVKRSR